MVSSFALPLKTHLRMSDHRSRRRQTSIWYWPCVRCSFDKYWFNKFHVCRLSSIYQLCSSFSISHFNFFSVFSFEFCLVILFHLKNTSHLKLKKREENDAHVKEFVAWRGQKTFVEFFFVVFLSFTWSIMNLLLVMLLTRTKGRTFEFLIETSKIFWQKDAENIRLFDKTQTRTILNIKIARHKSYKQLLDFIKTWQ